MDKSCAAHLRDRTAQPNIAAVALLRVRPTNVHAPNLLTPEEFASLLEVAVSAPEVNIPAAHLSKLVTLGYVALTAKGPLVTGDGLIHITEGG